MNRILHLGRLLLIGGAICAVQPASAAEAFDHAHSRFATVLSKSVSDGRVDYARLRAAPGDLDAYLNELAAVKPAEFASWSRENRLALLLNLYNAWTLRLIVDNYPLKSIRDIGFLPGAAWREQIVRFGGEIMALGHLENKIIRAEYGEPRIHFALVCAAKGCPPLRAEPYVGQRLNGQLDDQTKKFLATTEKNRFDPAKNTLWVSPIFKWYIEDFTGNNGSIEAYVKPFLPDSSRKALGLATNVKVRYTDYDWSLNDQTR